ncbi:MAG: hypothetical protein OEV30_10830, partial [Ignavibacteria bacterium]|nr:hypothetical protein [Ignavibacteria bacterium]
MKYLQNGGYQSNVYMRMTISFALVFLIGFVVTNFLLYFSKMDLTTGSVVSYYAGSEAEYRPARSYQSMLEVTHGHLPMMALVLLLLTHLVILAPLSGKLKATFVIIPFVAGLLSEGSGWLVRFVSPNFALLKITSFLVLQVSLILLLAVLGAGMLLSRTQMAAGSNGKAKPYP